MGHYVSYMKHIFHYIYFIMFVEFILSAISVYWHNWQFSFYFSFHVQSSLCQLTFKKIIKLSQC